MPSWSVIGTRRCCAAAIHLHSHLQLTTSGSTCFATCGQRQGRRPAVRTVRACKQRMRPPNRLRIKSACCDQFRLRRCNLAGSQPVIAPQTKRGVAGDRPLQPQVCSPQPLLGSGLQCSMCKQQRQLPQSRRCRSRSDPHGDFSLAATRATHSCVSVGRPQLQIPVCCRRLLSLGQQSGVLPTALLPSS